MTEENQDLDDLAAYESDLSIDERLAGREIAKILREKNFSYKQKSKVLHFVDKALYMVLINECDSNKKASQAICTSKGHKKTFSVQNNLIKTQHAQK